MKKLLFLLAIGIVAIFAPAFGQQTDTERARQERERYEQQRRIREQEEKMRREGKERQRSLEEWNREKIIQSRRPEYKPLSEEDLKKIKAALAPNSEDSAQYKDFLQQAKTGLFRLMPNRDCSQKYIVSANEDCQNSTFAGEFYSFRAKNYNSDFFDLTFKDGELISKGFLAQGILVSLGDVPLENLLPTSNGVKFLFDFEPQTENKAVKKQFAEIAFGINFDGYKYTKSEKALLNTTYALRVVAYRPDNKVRFGKNEMNAQDLKFFQSKGDKRTDLTLAFRIVRKDADGSLSILWKELNRQEAPKITFREDEPLTDINK